jgi:hypothetical protein
VESSVVGFTGTIFQEERERCFPNLRKRKIAELRLLLYERETLYTLNLNNLIKSQNP